MDDVERTPIPFNRSSVVEKELAHITGAPAGGQIGGALIVTDERSIERAEIVRLEQREPVQEARRRIWNVIDQLKAFFRRRD